MPQPPLQPTITRCAGEEIHLLPQGLAHWPAQATLLVADLHLGKTATFRRAGIPVPEGGMDDDLARLSALCAQTKATSLIILGDFFHAPAGRTPAIMDRARQWLDTHPDLKITLIMGNHDISAGRPPADWNIEIHNQDLKIGPFTMIHQATGTEKHFTFSGHIHPAIRIKSKNSRNSMRVPCFWQSKTGLILPSYGSFTGTHTITPSKNDQIWAILGPEIAPIPSALWR